MVARVPVVGGGSLGGAGADRSRSFPDLIRESARVLAGAAFVGLLVGGIVGGVLGRLAMRLLVLTTDDRFDGFITDDDAVVNEFTLGGTIFLIAFLAFGGAALAWLYVGARSSMPAPLWARSTIWAALVWSVVGSGVFDPDGFDFTRLTPVWLGVGLFSAIFLAVGALIALGVERTMTRWPSRLPGLLPLAALLPAPPIYLGGVVAVAGAWLSERWRAVRLFGALVMLAVFLNWGPPTAADVIRILV